MRQYLLLLLGSLLFTGCFRVVPEKNIEIVQQGIADTSAALSYIDNMAVERQDGGTRLAVDAIRNHGKNIADALEIKPEDLPSPRVSKSDWKIDPNDAHDQSLVNAKSDSQSIQSYAMYGLGALTIGAIGIRLGASLLAATPAGNALGILGTLFGYAHPVKDKVHDKIIAVLEDYKDKDPEWRKNPLYQMLSDKLTNAEKDYIKGKRNAI